MEKDTIIIGKDILQATKSFSEKQRMLSHLKKNKPDTIQIPPEFQSEYNGICKELEV